MKILDIMFGCWHKRISFPQSSKPGQRRSTASCQTGTYVVCLDCGKEFAYDWQTMKIVPSVAGKSRPGPAIEVEVNG